MSAHGLAKQNTFVEHIRLMSYHFELLSTVSAWKPCELVLS